MKKLTILHTESAIGWGGQEMRILSEANAMRKKGYRVIIACVSRSKLAREAHQLKIPVKHLPFENSVDWPIIEQLRRFLEQEKVDILNSHSEVDSWIAALAAEPIPFVKVIRTKHLSTPVKKDRLTHHLYDRFTDAVITMGESLRERLICENGIPRDRIFSIPTGIDLDRFNPTQHSYWDFRKILGLSFETPVIGTVAMLRRMKGHSVLLKAAVKVLRVFPQAKFLIVGDIPGSSPLRLELETQVQRLGLQDHVIFTGYRTNIPEILASLDCFVLASTQYEAVPQAVNQALAMARPIVATNVGATSEIVKNEITGILVPPRNVQALADGIISVLHSPERARERAIRGQKLIHEQYGLEHMAEKIEQLYKRLMNGRTR